VTISSNLLAASGGHTCVFLWIYFGRIFISSASVDLAANFIGWRKREDENASWKRARHAATVSPTLRLAANRLPNYARALFRANRSHSKAVSGTDIRGASSKAWCIGGKEGKKRRQKKEGARRKKKRANKKRAREKSVFRFLITATSSCVSCVAASIHSDFFVRRSPLMMPRVDDSA